MDNFYKNALKSCLDTPKSGNTTSRDTVLGMKPGSFFEHYKKNYIFGIKSVFFSENWTKLDTKTVNKDHV